MITKMMNLRSAAIATILFGNAAIGCAVAPQGATGFGGPQGPAVHAGARSTLIKSSGAPQAGLASGLIAVNGTYGDGCTDRSGGWSVAVGSYAGALANAPLSVATGDTGCVLIMTELVGSGGTLEASPSIDLGGAYQPQASAFAVVGNEGPGPVAFYANAQLSAADFSSDFVIDVIYSNEPQLATASALSTYSTQSGSATSSQVPAPDYFLDLTAMNVQTDTSGTVTFVGGEADLSLNSTAGQAYVVDMGTLPSNPTFDQIDGVFNAQSPTTLSGTAIPAAAFSLVGATLPTVRNLIIVNQQAGVSSYQFVAITINAP